MYLFSIMPEGFKELSFAESVKYEDYDLFCWNGESRLDNWKVPKLAWLNDEFTNSSDPKPDITAISGIFAVNERAYQVLKDMLGGQVEFLSTVGPDADSQWRLLNITNYLGLLEPAKSIYEIYDDGEVGMCQHGFLNKPAWGNRIFGVKEYAPNIFIDEETKSAIESAGLTGQLIREYLNP